MVLLEALVSFHFCAERSAMHKNQNCILINLNQVGLMNSCDQY